MKVIYRNFIKLLSAGTFNTEETIEPMSEFKWKQLLKLSEFNDVSFFVISGMEKISRKHQNIIPESVMTYTCNKLQEIDSNVFTTQYNANDIIRSQNKKFSAFYLNVKLNRIVFNEIHSIDTSIDSLTFLALSIENVRSVLAIDLNIRAIIDLGRFLRLNGDKIDFIKMEVWFKKLEFTKMMNLMGCYLMSIFHFEKDELPFMKRQNKDIMSSVYLYLDKCLATIENEGNGVMKSQTRQTPTNDTIRLKYFSYFPLEVSARFFSNIIKRISNIEE